MKRLLAAFAACLITIFGSVPVGALIPVPTTQPPGVSPLLITAYQATGASLEFVQLYNDSDELISLDGMSLNYTLKTGAITGLPITTAIMSGYIEPGSHIVLSSETSSLRSYAAFGFAPSGVGVPVGTTLKTIEVTSGLFAPVTLAKDMKTDGGIYGRSRTTTGYSTATTAMDSALVGSLFADPLYQLPSMPLMRIVEVSARAKTCTPFDISPTCGDYIKLHAPGFDSAALAHYRLRTNTGSESATNTFSLANASRHGDFVLLRLRDDGELLSLTNSGGYVWLEDAYGVQRFDTTMVEYADAGSEDYIDRSWGYDDSSSEWRWATPNPTGANVFPVLETVKETEDLVACPAGKYRNPETNRCRSIEEAVNALTACEEGKERNPTTNRCRSVFVASTTLTPCEEGEERNPSTNRCRKVAGASNTTAPCPAGSERNPSTNRCRRTTGNSPASTPAAALEQSGGVSLQNMLLVTAGLGALGYGFYEWRSEIARAARRLAHSVTGK